MAAQSQPSVSLHGREGQRRMTPNPDPAAFRVATMRSEDVQAQDEKQTLPNTREAVARLEERFYVLLNPGGNYVMARQAETDGWRKARDLVDETLSLLGVSPESPVSPKSECTAGGPRCTCGGVIEGWICQTCHAEFAEDDDGRLAPKSECEGGSPVEGVVEALREAQARNAAAEKRLGDATALYHHWSLVPKWERNDEEAVCKLEQIVYSARLYLGGERGPNRPDRPPLSSKEQSPVISAEGVAAGQLRDEQK